jgi:transcriptional regulator with XRE-family HTH domain
LSGLERQLGVLLRHLREQRNWSQEELAEAANLDRSYLGEIERGQVSPSLATLEKLAKALHLSLSELFRRCETAPPQQRQTQHDGDRP